MDDHSASMRSVHPNRLGIKNLCKIHLVKRNVDHLETVLEYTPLNEEDDTPDVVGSSVDKTSYEQAIATGKSYIEDNS